MIGVFWYNFSSSLFAFIISGTLTDFEREIDAVEVPSNGKGVTKPGRCVCSRSLTVHKHNL